MPWFRENCRGLNPLLSADGYPSRRAHSKHSQRRQAMGMQDRETSNLIGSDKVEGTTVYGADRKQIGSVERVMIDKRSGQVKYAVLSFGGFLGIGDDYYPLPWQSLTYDESLGGYVTNITEDSLKAAPKYSDESTWNWSDQSASSVN